MNIILGINCFHADSSACLIVDNKLVAAVEEERLNRIKHFAGLPIKSIEYCISKLDCDKELINNIAINSNPGSNFKDKLFYSLKNPTTLHNKLKNFFNRQKLKLNIGEQLKKNFGLKNFKVHRIDHHLSHIASSYYACEFKECLAVSVDGFGDFASINIAKIDDGKIEILDKVVFPNSLGVFYEGITQYLGFPNYGDEYKMMGLAAFGQPTKYDELKKILFKDTLNPNKMNINYFNHHSNSFVYSFVGTPKQSELLNGKFNEIFNLKRTKEEKILQEHMDLAASAQKLFEEIIFDLLKKYKNISKNLILSGGCAMNSVANGHLVKKDIFENIFIPYAPGDGGGSIGAAAHVSYGLNKSKPKYVDNPYLGPSFTDNEIEDAINRNTIDNQIFKILKFENEKDTQKNLSKFLSEGKVVGYFQDSMEFGSRALGNRSILCDPRIKKIDEYLNLKIKRRESFRPFAPSIIESEVVNWFEQKCESPYMSFVLDIKENKKKLIPAVTHFNGTGRLQTVTEKLNKKYYNLINEFYKITKVPILLNTSFNENEPIVSSPDDAIKCFLRTKMDVLCLQNFIIVRKT
ncbi:carbamoyltransferase [Candidatus Pelagibacter ubique]|nr:carbamoyltransferase [Candidatus Pelagibacter ubique]